MRSVRRKLSLLLALAMVMASCLNPGMTSRAEEGSGLPSLNIGPPIVDLTGLPDGGTETYEPEVKNEAQDEIGNVPEATGSNAEDDFYQSQIPSVMSLLPLRRVNATLGLNGYSAEMLKAVPLETVLKLMRNEDGEPIDFTDATIVWAYFKDKDGNRLHDELHVRDQKATVDMSRAADMYKGSNSFEMELIVGTGKQLDETATRYIVTVYISEELKDRINFYLWDADGNGIDDSNGLLRVAYANSTILAAQGIPVTAVIMQTKQNAGEYYLEIYSDLEYQLTRYEEQYRDMSVNVYLMKDFLKNYSNGKVGSLADTATINDQIFAADYKSKLAMADTAEAALDSDNLFCIAYTDNATGEVLAYQGLYVVVQSVDEMAKLQVLKPAGGKMEEAAVYDTYDCFYSGNSIGWYIESSSGSNGIRMETDYNDNIYGYMYDYYYLNSDTYPQGGSYLTLNSRVKVDKVVNGRYDTPEEAAAAGAKDITAQILADDKTKVPYGYNSGDTRMDYTVFYANGIAAKYRAYIQSDVLSESIGVSVSKDSGSCSSGSALRLNSNILEAQGIPVKAVTYYDSYHEQGDTYRIRLRSRIASEESRHKVNVDVYPMKEFLKHYKDGVVDGLDPNAALTKDILYQTYPSDAVGYTGTFDIPANGTDITAADNLLCFVYTDPESGKVIGYIGYLFMMAGNHDIPVANLYESTDGKMSKASRLRSESYSGMSSGWSLNFRSEANGVYSNTSRPAELEREHRLNVDHHTDSEYYFGFDAGQGISKVVLGQYNSLEEAQGAKDITSQIVISDPTASSFGYKANFSLEENQKLTVFTTYGSVFWYTLEVLDGGTSVSDFTEMPLVNEVDRWFRVTGAKNARNYSAYVVENNSYRTLDTLYGYGYQTVFLLDPDVDLAHIMPTFETSSDNVRVRRSDQATDVNLKSGEFEDDFSDGPVQYTIIVNDVTQQRNYRVAFVQKVTGGSQLYVNHPDQEPDVEGNTRELFLTEYFENRHDILIANIGDQPLTGLKVELKDAEHVKLDDYWTVGGNGNDTLQAFNYAFNSDDYGTMPNLAKIRLVPDGEGDIKGTLTISADGSDPVVIKLTGIAANPKIMTASMSNAVKYVPYSQVITTTNMYDWNKVSFSIVDGELPEGVTLGAKSGEIYGVPKESGEFTFTVRAEFSSDYFLPSEKEFTLTVADNTNSNVYMASDSGYALKDAIGVDAGGYDFVLSEISDQLFTSEGVYPNFDHKVFLNGELLVEDVDYTSESGSTRITIKSQTFRNKAKRDGTANTIAAEFRVNSGSIGGGSGSETEGGTGSGTGSSSGSGIGDVGATEAVKEMKRTAQNFRIPADTSSSSDSSSETTVVPDSKWTQDEHGWRHQLDDGSWAASSWQKLTYNGVTNWYYFGADGYMMTGWFTDTDGRRYYLNPVSDGTQGAMAVGWRFIDGEWYYFNTADEGTEGSLTDSGWRYLEYNGVKDWYYFDSRQIMASGWITADGRRYYLNPVSDGFKGRMLTGWQQVDGRWYYFDEQAGGPQGAMVTDRTIGEYYVGRDGVWVR